MPQDILGRNVETGNNAFKADSAHLSFGNDGGTTDFDLLVQSLDASYGQAITRLYELGSAKITFVAGRTQGGLNLARVLGPTGTSAAFISQFSDVCNLASNTIIFYLNKPSSDDDACDNSDEGFIAKGCVINSVSYNVQSQDLVVQQRVSMQLVSLELTKDR